MAEPEETSEEQADRLGIPRGVIIDGLFVPNHAMFAVKGGMRWGGRKKTETEEEDG